MERAINPASSRSTPRARKREDLVTEISPGTLAHTSKRLVTRIGERFGDCEVLHLAAQVDRIVSRSHTRLRGSRWLGFMIRLVIWPTVIAALVALGYGIYLFNPKIQTSSGLELVQGIESLIQVLLVLAATTWFFLTLNTRLVRGRLLRAVQELRSLAHAIDLDQLDKDPDRLKRQGDDDTPTSPKLGDINTPFLLSRYLDYCGEMLSLIGKVAAIYAEKIDDPIVLSELGDVERLTNDYRLNVGMKMASVSQMIGQKVQQ